MNYYLAPSSGAVPYAHFSDTVMGDVPFADIAPLITDEGKRILAKEPVIHVWGNLQRTYDEWKKLLIGDKVIFYVKGKLVAVGEVYHKEENERLSRALWEADKKAGPFKYTFFIRDVTPLVLPIKTYAALGAYDSIDNFKPQGFRRIATKHISAIETQFGSMERFLQQFVYDPAKQLVQDAIFSQAVAATSPKPVVHENAQVKPAATREKTPPTYKRQPRKVNYLERARVQQENGERGEVAVREAEKQRLQALGRPDLAAQVKRVSEEDDTLGYDVLSFEADGSERHIEVKSSDHQGGEIKFNMSRSEYEKAHTLPNYYLYYVEDVKGDVPTISQLQDPFNKDMFLAEVDTYLLRGTRIASATAADS